MNLLCNKNEIIFSVDLPGDYKEVIGDLDRVTHGVKGAVRIPIGDLDGVTYRHLTITNDEQVKTRLPVDLFWSEGKQQHL